MWLVFRNVTIVVFLLSSTFFIKHREKVICKFSHFCVSPSFLLSSYWLHHLFLGSFLDYVHFSGGLTFHTEEIYPRGITWSLGSRCLDVIATKGNMTWGCTDIFMKTPNAALEIVWIFCDLEISFFSCVTSFIDGPR
jgi:hypothetical protein